MIKVKFDLGFGNTTEAKLDMDFEKLKQHLKRGGVGKQYLDLGSTMLQIKHIRRIELMEEYDLTEEEGSKGNESN